MATQVKVIFHPAHLGASAADSPLDLMLRTIALAFATERDRQGWGEPDKYGADVENDVFLMRPDYADAECDCGLSQKSGEWHARNPHDAACYRKALYIRQDAWDSASGWDADAPCDDAWRAAYDRRTKAHRAIARRLCRERKIPWRGGWASGVHCDCGVDDALKMWMEYERHGERCPHALPNFWYKPTGFRVTWYKYIGRESRHNGAEAPPDMLERIFATHPAGISVDGAVAALERVTGAKHEAWGRMVDSLNRRFGAGDPGR